MRESVPTQPSWLAVIRIKRTSQGLLPPGITVVKFHCSDTMVHRTNSDGNYVALTAENSQFLGYDELGMLPVRGTHNTKARINIRLRMTISPNTVNVPVARY